MTNVKIILLIMFSFATLISKADGIDRIYIYLNSKLIYMTNNSDFKVEYKINIGDTIIFDAWTDWNILAKAKLKLDYNENSKILFQKKEIIYMEHNFNI